MRARQFPRFGVIAAAIWLGSGLVPGPAVAELKNGEVTTDKIADGAVTFEKLAEDAVFMRTIVVSPVGPTPSDNCDALRAALDGISGNSRLNPYLVYVEPGIYDCGANAVLMKSHVSIQGAGRSATFIHGNINSDNGVVRGGVESDLRDLTVAHTGGVDFAVAISGPGGALNHITNVTALASNGSVLTYAIFLQGSFGTISGHSKRSLANVTAVADGGGDTAAIFIQGSWGFEIPLTNVDATAMNGLRLNDAMVVENGKVSLSNTRLTAKGCLCDDRALLQSAALPGSPTSGVTARHSSLISDDTAIWSSGSVYVVSSQLVGSIFPIGAIKCVGAFDGDFNPRPDGTFSSGGCVASP